MSASKSKEFDEDMTSRHSMRHSSIFRQGSSSERKLTTASAVSSKSQSRRTSKAQPPAVPEPETMAIADFVKSPDCCVLCGYGIPFTRCRDCEYCAHNKCIQALYCNKVQLNLWKCPKCVTISHLDEKFEDRLAREGFTADDDDETDPYDCPFCKIEMDSRNCECRECLVNVEKLDERLQRAKEQTLGYSKCMQYRDIDREVEVQNLVGEHMSEGKMARLGRVEEEIAVGKSTVVRRFCWSFSCFLLLVTLAFPIAFVCAFVFIFINCLEACVHSIHPICLIFLNGVKLPGSCIRGVISGRPMFASNQNVKYEKY